MLLNPQQWAITALIGLVLLGGSYIYGRHDGDALCRADQKNQQETHEKEVKASDVKIKNSAPGDSDKRLGIEWLLSRARK